MVTATILKAGTGQSILAFDQGQIADVRLEVSTSSVGINLNSIMTGELRLREAMGQSQIEIQITEAAAPNLVFVNITNDNDSILEWQFSNREPVFIGQNSTVRIRLCSDGTCKVES